MKVQYSLFIALSLFVILITGLTADEAENVIKYRQNVMKAIGGHTGAAASIIGNKVSYKADLLDHAIALEAMTKNIPGLFPADSDIGVTAAKEEVWSKRSAFLKLSEDTKKASAAFTAAVKSKNDAKIMNSFQKLGESCKACHKDFRAKNE